MKKIVLCILDGFGIRQEMEHNGIAPYAKNFNDLCAKYSYTELEASQEHVGLPHGQMGNSEVGHMTIGLGRVIYQDLVRIEKDFDIIKNHPSINDACDFVRLHNGVFHVIGLLSDGGVHSHQNHIHRMIDDLLSRNVSVHFHAILDGRDTPPASALTYIHLLLEKFAHHGNFTLATISGRYYAMDRDNRWERIQKAYDAIVCGNAPTFDNPVTYIQECYDQGITDEFIIPGVNKNVKGSCPLSDAVWIANFRADRVRQILQKFKSENSFSRVIGFHTYASEFEGYVTPLLEKEDTSVCLGSVLSDRGYTQLRIAETEKYAHVTFFFNAGKDEPFVGEDRILIPSPAVATYDLMPHMSCDAVLKATFNAVQQSTHHVIVVNFANPDMVGHTGVESAIIDAIQKIDESIQILATACLENDYTLIITADHGNAEEMYDVVHNQPHTAHTLNKVPFLMIDSQKIPLHPGSLADIAPTVLALMGEHIPSTMTGKVLF
ncbi:MAG: 2,3-bisphosphoglycerate-independent phosphoglycerate mutase [Holosporales bacterium]